MPQPHATTYRLAPSATRRLLGLLAALIAVTATAAAFAALVVDGAHTALLILLVSTAIGLVVITGSAWGLLRAWVVRVDETGYAVRFVRGAGTTKGRWREVEDAAATVRHGARCLELRLTSGARTTIPVSLLAVDDDQFVRDLQERLQAAQGLRRYQG